MLESYEEITAYLLDHDLICAERIVADDLAIFDVSRRHANFEVVSEGGRSYFLKQDVAAWEGRRRRAPIATVSYEADVYRMFARARRGNALCRYVPRCYRFDPAERLLVLEAIRDSQNLADYHHTRRRFPVSIAGEIGKALAEVHAAFGLGNVAARGIPGIPANLPWILSLPCPTQWLYVHSSGANREFLRIAQAADLAEPFDELRRQWRTDAVIHGDLKWTNCLVKTRSAAREGSRIRLVDWELASRGDSCWDVGSLLSEYLNLWLSSVPASGDEPPDRYLDAARFPLERMQPSIRSLWSAYVRRGGFTAPEAGERLVRAVCYSAARLVQTSYEQLQDQPAVTNGAVYRLQVCRNILARPEEAAVQLLGLPLPETARGV